MNYILIGSYGNKDNNWTPDSSSVTIRKISNTQGNIYALERINGYWLAIGY